ncbi:hypothetical protein [Halopiger djelfimassiliensis]|uniref:hypothetical protein n=1 Tax=Halopiger djelfimassiliensis TaxID=1293047 RepID=UPI0006782FB0|nr:hypothetical protein [Halopiger djelfimassiliensis]
MRTSKGTLLVVFALTLPFLVELRTVLAWVNVELTVLESVGIALAILLALLAWAMWPQNGETSPSGSR